MAQLSSSHGIRAAFLDFDGLLIDSEGVYMDCIHALTSERSCPPMPEDMIGRTFGTGDGRLNIKSVQKWMEENLLGDGKWTTREDFQRDYLERCARAMVSIELLDGAEDLIRTLATRAWVDKGDINGGIRKVRLEVAIVSNTTISKFAIKSAPHGVFTLIPPNRKLCSDDPRLAAYPRRKKPAPDLYLAALSILNKERGAHWELRPDECLVFEDSAAGVGAARKAGMRVVWVPHPLARKAYRGLEAKVFAGSLGEEVFDSVGGGRRDGEEEGESERDEMAEVRESLVGFDYGKYGIFVSEPEE